MRAVFQSRIRRPLAAIAVVALILLGIVWIRHALALHAWNDRHGGYRRPLLERLLYPNTRINSRIMDCGLNLHYWLRVLHEFNNSNGTLPQTRSRQLTPSGILQYHHRLRMPTAAVSGKPEGDLQTDGSYRTYTRNCPQA